ncbi:MAG: hypothetical protein JWO38_2187 [Gemmataceae bacterium]|nr:hypothetical protein [Gemmataceae bacterium]
MAPSPWYTVGIGGQARSGKDTLGAHLVEQLNRTAGLGRWERRGFADAVKRIFMDVFDVDATFVETWKTVPEPPPGFRLPVRSCLTLIGDGFRQMRPTVWIDRLFRDVRSHLVVTDVRYRNEVHGIRHRSGVIILLYRPGFTNDIPSPAEQELLPLIRRLLDLGTEGPVRGTDVPCDYFLINGGSIEDLLRKADECVLPDLVRRVRGLIGGET